MGDIFKEVPLRFIGFSFALAEAGRYRFRDRIIEFAMGIGTIFIVAHILHAAVTNQTLPAVIDAVFFEGLCSILIPPAFNHFFCRLVADVVNDFRSQQRMWIIFISGFIIIPIMMQIVDEEVDQLIQDLVIANIPSA